MSQRAQTAATPINSPGQVLFASLIGTTIEFFDFYIYATAAVSAFPLLFFPPGDAGAALLASMATFGVAFVARPELSRSWTSTLLIALDHCGYPSRSITSALTSAAGASTVIDWDDISDIGGGYLFRILAGNR